MKNQILTSELIGKYINRYGYSDINPIGKIVGIKSKTIVLVQRIEASENKTKMNFEVGGFSAICTNNWNQEYDFTELSEVIEVRISKSFLKGARIDETPVKHYDYNF
jgi:hypothetical protein